MKPPISLYLHQDALPSWGRIVNQNLLVPITQQGNLFPAMLKFKIIGLDADKLYLFFLKFTDINNVKYALDQEFVVQEKVETGEIPPHDFLHNNEIKTGRVWMSSPFSFDGICISTLGSNNINVATLQNRHCYTPEVTLIEFNPVEGDFHILGGIQIPTLNFIVMENIPISMAKHIRPPYAPSFLKTLSPVGTLVRAKPRESNGPQEKTKENVDGEADVVEKLSKATM